MEEFPWTTAQTESRSKGLHLSGVIHDMDKVLSLTTRPDWDTDEKREETLMQFEKGWLWEEALSRAFGAKGAHRIGEVSLDEIAMSPDGVVYGEDGKAIHIEEYKCTAYSSAKSPADMWRWMMQVKGYCKAVGVTKCVFRALHLSFVPVYKVWEIVFTQRELDENWEAVLNHVKTMKGE